MEKKLLYGIVITAVAAAVIVLVLESPPANSVANEAIIVAELHRLNIATVGAPEQVKIQLPSDLSGSNWELKASACQEGGYDLSAYAGKDVLLTSYPTNQWYNNTQPLQVWVITGGNNILCVYSSLMEGRTFTPGIFSVKENPLIISRPLLP
jgi:hypothetical protein